MIFATVAVVVVSVVVVDVVVVIDIVVVVFVFVFVVAFFVNSKVSYFSPAISVGRSKTDERGNDNKRSKA